ncbi:NmrA family protein [Hypoxylon crocopeplum]|nr:NmrA family protein [Hypoxylon crocopeplum]
MADLKEIAVIGGTGAQGMPVVQALAQSGRYRVRLLTRNTESSRAKQLASLPNVTLFQGAQDNQQDLHNLFRGVYGAWVNTDGFTLGEKDELFYGFRAYEIARSEGVQHYVWAAIEYGLEVAGFDEKYHCGHFDSKGRIGKFILALGQGGMKSTVFTTGPYMDMLIDGMFVPIEQPDGSFMWANPAQKSAKVPLIALCDIGVYNLWIFDNPSESAGINLPVSTDTVSFEEIAKAFTEVTGKPAFHVTLPFEEYAPLAEPYPGAFVNWSLGPDAARDDSVMTWRQNFGAWWRFYGEGFAKPGDAAILDRIHPKRIKSVAAWMKHVGYNGQKGSVLKMVEDWTIKTGASPYKV